MALSKSQSAEEDTNLIFVYGSLMRGMERASFINNPDKARFVSTGAARGTLYDAGSFPGMIESANGSMVVGELYELFDRDTFFETLDLIEGYWPDQPERSLYARKTIPVTTHEGTRIAWAYIFNQPVTGFQKIASGDFRCWETTAPSLVE
ncbi:MAG: gamma-glutamylcyclotransferase family protein [bacterium]